MAEENARAAMGMPIHEPSSIRDNHSFASKPFGVLSNLPERQSVDLKLAHERSQKEKEASANAIKRAQRAKDLANLIDLDFVFFEIFDLSPLNEYELYIRNYGISNAAQATTQTNDDCIDREVQCEDWTVEDKWTQCPPEQFLDCDACRPELPWLQDSRDSQSDSRGQTRRMDGGDWSVHVVDPVHLAKFLRKSSQVIEVLLEENTDGGLDSSVYDGVSTFEFSKGFAEINVPEPLLGQRVVDMCFTPGDYRSLLIAWSALTKPLMPSFALFQGVMCVWRLNDPKQPSCLLLCEAKITCCCFAPTKPYLVFAGTCDGGVQAWDLREAGSEHASAQLHPNQDAITIRTPSYCTDGIYVHQRVHEHPIVSIIPLHKYEQKIVREVDTGASTSSDSDTFQIATVDTLGLLQLWVVIELKDAASVSETDLGMRIGSRIRLVRSSHFQMQHPDRCAFTREITVHDCKFMRNNIDRLIVATSDGFVSHESRFRDRCFPRTFIPTKINPQYLLSAPLPRSDPVTAIETCPHLPIVFAAGHESGLMALYTTQSKYAVVTWSIIHHPISQIEWSPHRPSVIFVLDQDGNIYIWDLLQNQQEPRCVVAGSVLATGDRRPSYIALSPTAASATSRVSLDNLVAAASRSATLVIGFDDGTVQVHGLDTEFSEMAVDEESEFQALIESSLMQSAS
eukprot:jgi/Hompol1/6041/HPOL_004813-RA